MDLQIGRNLTRNVEVFAAGENINDKRYFVANTPLGTGSLFNIVHRPFFAPGCG